jgi:hypothetical protein
MPTNRRTTLPTNKPLMVEVNHMIAVANRCIPLAPVSRPLHQGWAGQTWTVSQVNLVMDSMVECQCLSKAEAMSDKVAKGRKKLIPKTLDQSEKWAAYHHPILEQAKATTTKLFTQATRTEEAEVPLAMARVIRSSLLEPLNSKPLPPLLRSRTD